MLSRGICVNVIVDALVVSSDLAGRVFELGVSLVMRADVDGEAPHPVFGDYPLGFYELPVQIQMSEVTSPPG